MRKRKGTAFCMKNISIIGGVCVCVCLALGPRLSARYSMSLPMVAAARQHIDPSKIGAGPFLLVA